MEFPNLSVRPSRGGVRVIYFYRSAADVVYFLDIYAKAAKEDLTPDDMIDRNPGAVEKALMYKP
jgi:hypothetical protein